MDIDIHSPVKPRRVIGYTYGQNEVVYDRHYVMHLTGPLYLGMSEENGTAVHTLFLFYDDKHAGLKLGPITLEDDIEEYVETRITGRYDTLENLRALLRRELAEGKPIDSNLTFWPLSNSLEAAKASLKKDTY